MTVLLAAPVAAQQENEKAAKFFEAAFDEILSRSPMWQDQLGIYDHNDRWDDLSDAYAEETLRILRRLLSELEHSIDYDRLDPEARLSYELFVNNINNRILALEWRYHAYPVQQMHGFVLIPGCSTVSIPWIAPMPTKPKRRRNGTRGGGRQ